MPLSWAYIFTITLAICTAGHLLKRGRLSTTLEGTKRWRPTWSLGKASPQLHAINKNTAGLASIWLMPPYLPPPPSFSQSQHVASGFSPVCFHFFLSLCNFLTVLNLQNICSWQIKQKSSRIREGWQGDTLWHRDRHFYFLHSAFYLSTLPGSKGSCLCCYFFFSCHT